LGTALSSQVVLTGLFRLVTGLGIGAASAVVPPYISEIAPASIRGRLGSLWQFAIVFGQFLGLLAGYGLTRWAGSEAGPLPWGGAAWRWMFVVVALLAAAYSVITRGLPQSPQDLVRHGHETQARALLARIGSASAEEQAAAIRQAQAGHREVATLRDLRGPRFGLQAIVWTGMALATFQQLVGINVVKTYSNTLWQAVGLSTGASFTVSRGRSLS
jgi:SP family sugar:H+ symporter-like MFS transporter